MMSILIHSFADSASKMRQIAARLLVQVVLLPSVVMANNVFRLLRAQSRNPRLTSVAPLIQTQTCLVHTLAAAAVTAQTVNHALLLLLALFPRMINQ
jgi:hypothetical protein